MSRSRGEPLTETDRARLRLLVDRRGEHGAAQALGIEPRTLARCLAGLTLYPATRALVREKLIGLGKDAA